MVLGYLPRYHTEKDVEKNCDLILHFKNNIYKMSVSQYKWTGFHLM